MHASERPPVDVEGLALIQTINFITKLTCSDGTCKPFDKVSVALWAKPGTYCTPPVVSNNHPVEFSWGPLGNIEFAVCYKDSPWPLVVVFPSNETITLTEALDN